MTARELYEFALIEINKIEAPSLLLEDYNYFINKAVQQYINLTYNRYNINQQSTDDLRVLKTNLFLETKKLSEDPKLAAIKNKIDSGLMSGTYYVDLPKDYMHLLNCIVTFNKNNNFEDKCNRTSDSEIYFTAKRLTEDMYGGIINNYYLKPSYKRPYYYLNTITPDPMNLDADREILDSEPVRDVIKDTLEGSQVDLLTGVGSRLANSSNVRLELRIGDDRKYVPTGVYIEYIKAPMHIRLSQDQIYSDVDTSQILEFPDYVCLEILNIFTRLIMENAGDPRLQTNVPINQTVGQIQSGK